MGYPYNVPPYAVVSPKDVGLLHQASLDILATIGVRVLNARVLDLPPKPAQRSIQELERQGIGGNFL
jgi:hypothetical protein